MAYQINIANREINQRVINFFQFENGVTTLEFTLDNYIYDEVDLRNYKAYAITSIKGSVDMTELEMNYDEVDDKLTLTWNVGDYTITQDGAIIYQITFKENEDDGENSAVWYSYKAVMINRGTVDADHQIVAEYPTIMKQWLDKMESMEDELIKVKDTAIDEVEDTRDEAIEDINDLAAKFDTSVVYIPYGETIPVEDRLSNRLYYQYTDEAQTRGRFEDSEGVILNLDPTGYVTHIGQTIFSLLPIDNAGLHLLDGTKLLGDGAYGDFVEYVAKLYEKSLNCFCTEAEWQQSVTNYGVCGKFVYDSIENSVRLPKVTGFVEGTIDPYALGNLVEAGLPNITGKFEAKGFNSDFGTINYGSGAFDVKVAGGYDETANAGSTNIVNTDVAEFDASKSNDIYGNANTVQPQSIKGYYYMVIATSNVDEVGINGQSGAFLNQITNCLIEVPQRINYTLENNRLTIKAGSVMIVPYGTEDLTAQHPVGSAFLHENFKVYDTQFVDGKFFVLVETREDLKNKYSAETNTCHVFASINLGYGLTANEVISNTSGDTDTGTSAYRFWYDTANNFVKKFEGDATPVEDVFALPIMVAQSKVSVGWETINQVFNGFGYIGSTIWVDKGVRGLIPDGRNIDGSLNNVEFAIRNVSIMDTSSVYGGGYTLYLHKNTGLAVGSYWEYDKEINGFKHESSYSYGTLCEAGGIQLSNGRVTSLKPKTTFHAVDYNDIQAAGGGLEIGDIGIAPFGIDESQNKRRYLNGQVISQSQFESFTKKIKEAIALYPNLATSETNWQAEVTNSVLGQCGKFVVDDALGTIRLPKVVNVNGLADLSLMGSIKAESLPNITGSLDTASDAGNCEGAFKRLGISKANQGVSKTGGSNVEFNASNSSSTYQDNAPVQQEAILYPYFIQVATGVEESVDVTREIELNNPFFFGMSQYFESEPKNASWLISNGSFHSGTVYKSFYEWLLKIYNRTETVEGVSVKANTDAYGDYDYVINTADTTFRLPIKVKLASGNAVVGNGMTLGLTNGTNNGGLIKSSTSSTYLFSNINSYGSDVSSTPATGGSDVIGTIGVTTDPTKSGIETSSSGLKLYFYVGETIQDANVINASGVLTEIANADYVVESYNDGTNWYRVYKSGWVEQGGYSTTGFITFLKPFADANYSFLYRWQTATQTGVSFQSQYAEKTTTNAAMKYGGFNGDWIACGQGA